MKRVLLLVIVLLVQSLAWGQRFSVLTWNIQDLGRSKNPQEVAAMVEVMRDYDLVLVQEVVAKDPAGAQRVAQLADALDRTGSNWDYRVSDPTDSPSPYVSERYAMLWKASRLRLAEPPRLERRLAQVCDREPYRAAFRAKGSNLKFYIITFHARRHDNQPEEEIQRFAQYPAWLETEYFLIAGDFNLDERHEVWRPLKRRGFQPVVRQTPTTLKRYCQAGNYFNYPIDNIFYPMHHFRRIRAGRVDFVGSCANLKAARGISDHLPVYAVLEFR
jgi:deoxyribonuclease-1-like protein